MEDILNATQVETEVILEPEAVIEGWSFLGSFGDKIKESSSLLTALFIVLVTNIVFATSDSPATKRLMSLIMGLIILGILFSYTICHSLIIAFVVYVLNRFLKKRAPLVVLLFTIGYALGYHGHLQEPQHNYNIWGDLYKFSLIPLICKCISFTLCYSDSFKDPSVLSIDQDKRKIATLPSIYNYFCYVFHYISVFFGPPLDYYDYENFINASGEYTKFERNIKGTLANVSIACLSFLFYVILTCFIDPLIFFTNGLPEDSSLLYQIYMICAVGLVSRIFYYCIATFFQAGIELSGLSFGGIDDIGQMHFGRIKVINRAFILQTDPSAAIQSWNPSYYVWLKRYIYVRTASLHSIRQNILTKCLAIATTLVISYILLGFPPGGVIAYIHLFLLILASSYFHKGKWRLAKLPSVIRLLGSSIKWLYLYFAFSVFAIGIQIKHWEAAGTFYKGVGSAVILVELCILGFFIMTGWGKERVKAKENKQEKTEELEESDIPKIADETREYIESMRRKIEDQWYSKKTN